MPGERKESAGAERTESVRILRVAEEVMEHGESKEKVIHDRSRVKEVGFTFRAE